MKKDKNNLPLVSIITPVYNRSKYVEETMRSILDQDYDNLEYILIDDGSTDNSSEVVHKVIATYKNTKKRIYFFKQKNIGETKTDNNGFKKAKGEIISVVNSDDLLLPGAVTYMVKYLVEHPDVLATYPDMRIIDSESRQMFTGRAHEYDYRYMLKFFVCIVGYGAFFNRKALDLTKGRDPSFKYVADFDFWLRLGMYGKLMRIPKVLAAGRSHPDSQTQYTNGDAMANEHIRLVKKTFANKDLPKEFLSLKRYSFSQTYLMAGLWSFSKNKAIKSFIKSFYYHPRNFTLKLRTILRHFKKKQEGKKNRSFLGNILFFLGEIF